MTIADAVAAVRARIADAARRAGRAPDEVTLVAVAKGQPAASIAEAVAAGARDIGENRAQELVAKRGALSDAGIRWHMVGTLQRNKIARVVGAVALIHSVDSAALAEAIGARARSAGVVQEVLLEVNTSGEASKHGVAPSDALAAAAAVAATDGVALRGFMTIAAPGDPAVARRAFAALRELRDRAVLAVPEASELSMGMTDDLEEAIEEGATIVRVGTAIFGHRHPQEQAVAGEKER